MKDFAEHHSLKDEDSILLTEILGRLSKFLSFVVVVAS